MCDTGAVALTWRRDLFGGGATARAGAAPPDSDSASPSDALPPGHRAAPMTGTDAGGL